MVATNFSQPPTLTEGAHGAQNVTLIHERYQLLKIIGTDAWGRTLLVKDLKALGQPSCILQEFDLSHDDPSLTEYGVTLLTHKAQKLQTIFAQLSQANTIIDFFVKSPRFYLAEALVSGITLAKLPSVINLDALALSQQVTNLLQQALVLLDTAYSYGILSGCLHPQDLILRKADQRLVWTGFGIFKAVCQQIQKTQESPSETISKETLAYFAPEYWQGQFHPGSDIYTLGMMGIQTLTKRPLSDLVDLSDDSAHPTVKSNWHRWLKAQPASVLDLVALLTKMVHPNPAQRYQSPERIFHDFAKTHR